LIIYDYQQSFEVNKQLNNLTLLAYQMNIPLQPIAIDTDLAKTTVHTISASFRAHLEWAVKNGGLITKQNPLSLISNLYLVPGAELKNYLGYKFRKLEEGWHELAVMKKNPVLYFQYLKKLVEAPWHVARQILWQMQVPLLENSKEEISQRYQKALEKYRLAEIFQSCIGWDQNYTGVLMKAVKNQIDQVEYSKSLTYLEEKIPYILEFIRANAILADNISW
jgi:hypothetical protein